tara:strand:+ start:166 stop:576 length:411 start_codon:yes stop_codon:yes gene_type:complete
MRTNISVRVSDDTQNKLSELSQQFFGHDRGKSSAISQLLKLFELEIKLKPREQSGKEYDQAPLKSTTATYSLEIESKINLVNESNKFLVSQSQIISLFLMGFENYMRDELEKQQEQEQEDLNYNDDFEVSEEDMEA